jgi:hypothetical protein
MAPLTIPTVSEVDRIAAQTDPVIRNLQITQCYHELAIGMTERTGVCANWCTFATWASKQAGQTIRKEDLARLLEDLLRAQAVGDPATQNLAFAAQQTGSQVSPAEIPWIVWEALDPKAAFARSSESVARGNLKVFDEIGREFARFYAICLRDAAFDARKIDGFCEGLRVGEPPNGQRFLRQAFRNYYQAFFERAEKTRDELILLANLEIGFHEQTRLQPEINEALAAPITLPGDFVRKLIKALHPEWGWFNELIWLVLHLFGQVTDLDRAIDQYVAAAQRQAQFIITETLMSIELPGPIRLRLGDDLATSFPPILEHLVAPGLLDLLVRIDPTPDSTIGSGAEYWGDLPDRLHFIADMFRCYQLSETLFEAPFTQEQITAIQDGRLPEGRL